LGGGGMGLRNGHTNYLLQKCGKKTKMTRSCRNERDKRETEAKAETETETETEKDRGTTETETERRTKTEVPERWEAGLW
jgi:hypothetical protein